MKFLKWCGLIITALLVAACAINSQIVSVGSEGLAESDHYRDGKFVNTDPVKPASTAKRFQILKRMLTEMPIDNVPTKPLPLQQVTHAQLEVLSNDQVHIVKLGHSSILTKVFDQYWLFDPVFSLRASPSQFYGPKRFQPTPIKLEELPEISKVFISHNHYDHLDKAAIEKLAKTNAHFYVPLGIDNDLQKWGVSTSNITAMDWWQSLVTEDELAATIVFTPARHFSGRGLTDRDLTLWGSWVVKTPEVSLFFSGDSGYFEAFKEIGDKYGPFDLTMIETGAYSKQNWPELHMLPDQSVQAHIDLGGKIMLPIHNATFDLAFHPWYEPLKRVTREAKKKGVTITTPIVGQIFSTEDIAISDPWWQKFF